MRKLPTLFCLVAITIYTIFAAAPVQSSGAFFLCEKLPGPTAPAKPAPPAKPSLTGKQETPEPPAPIPRHSRQPAAKNESAPRETKPSEKKNISPEVVKPQIPEKTSREPQTNDLTTSVPEESPPAIAVKQTEERRFAIDWFKNSVFFLLIFAACGAIVYIHRKHPPMPQRPAPTLHTPDLSRIRHAALPDLEPAGAVKNKSLLEQLIKYDMETYGEIRSSLSYDQPAYVEHLIRKYGYGDKEKISRALHLYYQNRDKT